MKSILIFSLLTFLMIPITLGEPSNSPTWASEGIFLEYGWSLWEYCPVEEVQSKIDSLKYSATSTYMMELFQVDNEKGIFDISIPKTGDTAIWQYSWASNSWDVSMNLPIYYSASELQDAPLVDIDTALGSFKAYQVKEEIMTEGGGQRDQTYWFEESTGLLLLVVSTQGEEDVVDLIVMPLLGTNILTNSNIRAFDPRLDGFNFDNTIPPLSVSYNDAYASLSTASWTSSIPTQYLSQLALFSVATNSLQLGNCFGMVYTAKKYFENPSLLSLTFPGNDNLVEVDETLIASEIITNQFPGQEIIDHYLLNDLALYLEISTVKEQIEYTIEKIDQNEVVILFIDVPKVNPIFNHAVLAYDYDLSNNHVTLKVYDPNEATSTLFLEIDIDNSGNFDIVGGNLFTRYGVTKVVAGDFYKSGWTLISNSIENFNELVYDLSGQIFENFIRFEARSPVHILVISPNGLMVGYNNLTQSIVNQISGSIYSGIDSEPQTIIIPSPLEGNYSLELFGFDTGDYNILIDTNLPETGNLEVLTYSGSTHEGKSESYSIQLSNNEIIPEFPTWIILPLFLIISLASIGLSKKLKNN